MRLFVVALALSVAVPLFGQLRADFSGSNITITGATNNGRVAVYGVGQAIQSERELVAVHQSMSRASAAGVLTVTVQYPAYRSVWVVFDVDSGEYAIASPRGYAARRVAVPAGAFAGGGKGLEQPRTQLLGFIARRRVGAWCIETADGAAIDDDHRRNNVTRALLDSFVSVGDSPPPPHALTPDDVVFVIDSDYMQYWAAQVTPKDMAGGPDASH